MIKSKYSVFLLLGFIFLTSGCHKTFFNDEPTAKVKSSKPEAPKEKVLTGDKVLTGEASASLVVECVYETSSNLKLQLALDRKMKKIKSASLYDVNKTQTAESRSKKVEKQSKKEGMQILELEDGTTLLVPLLIYTDSEGVEVRVNEDDIYLCL
ncbi:MAG: hypothetical protein IPM97_03295 [Bdellovibrionaceae bacterium]|nr:hypothetical protein [Pseudobdellovibrionaceae bacterium]